MSEHSATTANNGHNGKVEYGSGAPVNRAITPGGHPMDSTQPAFPIYHRRFANPAPLGLSAFALTTFLLSLYNVHARGIQPAYHQIIIGPALAYGGLVQLLAGMWEFACGNTFGATAFSSYGGFWLAFGLIIHPSSGVSEAYADAADQEASALGLFLHVWGVFTFIMFVASLKSSMALVSLFGFLTITFFLLGAGELAGSVGVTKAGGWFGLITALIAWYTALAGLLTPDTSHFLLPVGELSRGRD